MALEFRGVHADILLDKSPERDVEGSLNCGKTTVCLWAELNALKEHAGIWILLARYSDDAVSTKLRPAFEQLISLHTLGKEYGIPKWDDKKKFYEFGNGSRAYAFGLKAQSVVERYEKIRGLPVSRIFVDQAEALPGDIGIELRARLRPDIIARERGVVFPTQLTFSANPVNDDHWLAKQFPVHNNLKRRRYFCVALTDNAHNLPQETIDGMLQATPPDHPKYQTVILGQRGLNVIGDPVYDGLFDRSLHVRSLFLREQAPLMEAYEVGKHNPCWMVAQRTYTGGINFLGGILGKGLVIEDFLPIVNQYREEWFPNQPQLKSCTAPIGDKHTTNDLRFTLVSLLRNAGLQPVWKDSGNAPDVRLAMIEYMASNLRKRSADRSEAVGIEAKPSRWLYANRDGITEKQFLAFAFDGGYTWSDHFVSVSHKEIRQANEDDEFANAMHCVENICLNFCATKRTPEEEQKKLNARRRETRQRIVGGEHSWMA